MARLPADKQAAKENNKAELAEARKKEEESKRKLAEDEKKSEKTRGIKA